MMSITHSARHWKIVCVAVLPIAVSQGFLSCTDTGTSVQVLACSDVQEEAVARPPLEEGEEQDQPSTSGKTTLSTPVSGSI